MLADLAAAYIVQAQRGGTPRDLIAAIEAAGEALEREPRNPAARYNLALALERFGLLEEAADAWRAYLAADPGSPWVPAARQHLDALLAFRTVAAAPAPYAPVAAYRAYARAEPGEARKLGWCRELGAWADSARAGKPAGAEARLLRAEALAQVLERRPGGDASLADGVRAIRSRAGGTETQRLARAHAAFAAGCAAMGRVDFPGAASRFSNAGSAGSGSPALEAWARVMYGYMVYLTGEPEAAERILRGMSARVDSVRHPALAGEARQSLAALLLRTDRHEAGLAQAQAAAALFARAGEREQEGVAVDAMSIAHLQMRNLDQGYALAHRALERLRPYRGSFRLHNMLAFTGQTVAEDGFRRAAIRLLNEGVRVAERTGTLAFAAEARLIRARLLADVGALALADRDVAAGHAALEALTSAGARAWMRAQLQIASAAGVLRTRPSAAAEALDSAAAYFTAVPAPLVAFPAVVRGAQARLAAGDERGGVTRLEAALGILERRRDSLRMEPRRAAVFEAARGVVDQVVMLKLAAGRPAEALAYLDRGRASLAPAGRPGAGSADPLPSAPRREVALQYALVGDTLLVWTVGRRLELYRTVVDAARLVQSIESVRQQLAGAAGEAELRVGLAHLYDQLLRPVEGRLGGAETPLVVVTDGELASVPFPALYDARRERYLVEDRPLRFFASLREAWRPGPAPRGSGKALFVADPAFDRARHPELTRLVAAAAEAREIAAGYPGARMLEGAAATPAALRSALGGAGLVHYAGHAVFDDERPEQSYLLLAPAPGASASVLHAAEIAQLDLRHVSLVVLAACQTVRTGPGRAAGFSGLAGAFLAAGAGGAVGSLWDVDDRTTRALMMEFHRAYRGAPNPAAALRQAQLRLLRSSDPALRSPAAWSGFRYAGS
ncbi:MAG TPA: CHAT domain-containing protein [Longimicrobium sp.]|nr:CHAT domain-containing protein [Longimicrobium sp.]